MPTPLRRPCLALLFALALAGCAAPAARDTGWRELPLGTDAVFHDAFFLDSLNGWLAGGGPGVDGGLLGRTRDGGRTWDYTSGISGPGRADLFHLQTIWFLDLATGLAGTDGGRIYKTDDGGRNWRLVHYGRGAGHVFDLRMLDARHGWAAGLGGVLRTSDGGETWNEMSRPGREEQPSFGHAIACFDTARAFKVGQHGALEATSDGGRHWVAWPTPLAAGEKPYLFDIDFADERNGWIVGENGTILHTADGGATWERQETGLPDAKERPRPPGSVPGPPGMEEVEGPLHGLFLTRVRFVDARRGWATGFWFDQGRSVVLGTADGGATWAIEADVQGEELRALAVLPGGRAWAAGDRSRPGPQVLLALEPRAR